MKYKDNETNEEVEEEIWRWEACYKDGKVIRQFDDEKKIFHKFKEINQEELFVFKVYSLIYPNTYTLIYEKGMKLFYYYDRYTFFFNTPEEKKMTVYCFGYEKEKEKKVFCIMPNGELIITSNPEVVKLEI